MAKQAPLPKLTHERFNSPTKVIIDGVVLYDPKRDGDEPPDNLDEMIEQLVRKHKLKFDEDHSEDDETK